MANVTCDVRTLPADAAVVDALARLQLEARRLGLELHFCHASSELRCLIGFCGLDEALGLESERQPEKREQGLGVEEEGQLRDPPA
ncbi:MAG TPA: hypothetical protein VH297_00380 [Gaiellaceae bacterium]|jgi:hypothetical protein